MAFQAWTCRISTAQVDGSNGQATNKECQAPRQRRRTDVRPVSKSKSTLHHQIMAPKVSQYSSLKSDDLLPGQRVSIDHYVLSLPGRLYESRGGTPIKDMYHGGAIFVDHASGYIGVRHKVSLGAADTIQAKLSFEQEAYDHGVTLQSFHKDFVKALDDKNQTIRYSGANTRFQAGVSERAIRTVVSMA